MENKTCATCTENDGGLCDLKGLLVEDDDTCEDGTVDKQTGGNICFIRFWPALKKVTKWKIDAYVAGR